MTELVGYILEVELSYPPELHDEHNSLPFCRKNKKAGGSKYKNLIAGLHGKRKYVIHYHN